MNINAGYLFQIYIFLLLYMHYNNKLFGIKRQNIFVSRNLNLAVKSHQASCFEPLQLTFVSYNQSLIGESFNFITIYCIVLAPCFKCLGFFIYSLNILSQNDVKDSENVMVKPVKEVSSRIDNLFWKARPDGEREMQRCSIAAICVVLKIFELSFTMMKVKNFHLEMLAK